MNEMLAEISQMALLEVIAVLSSLIYVVLAAKGQLLCWPFAILASAIYCYIFFDVRLLMDSLLQVYYVLIAVYGWMNWQQHKNNNSALQIQSLPLRLFIVHGCILITLSLAIAFILASNTDASYPYLDTLTTVFSFYATYLIATRVLENWLYWIVIDAVSIYLYINKSLYLTAFLFVCYTLIAVYGYFSWRKQKTMIQPTHSNTQPINGEIN
ncbi:nicotinamide riboside transporter PnuC [Catenovulum sediminis]|uniref:Nicotinamide riboside transporter PnuC n=1 Tax=Catenovulum sediminis TaxID=1740262 RepID=A0ABV1REQ2_9ALTE|nr:nicotinamide riboside transporter PnuC [Catenovulum sediminis]